MTNEQLKTCVLTGANGYVGGRLQAQLEPGGWRVIPWTRRADVGSAGQAFRLGEEIEPGRFRDVQALVHCAYDFGSRGWNEIRAVNVVGSQMVLRAARDAGVGRIVFISSVSAFAGCRSMYGKAKLEIEATARSLGATIIRPGLVYGPRPGGVFGRLVRQVQNSRLVPLLHGSAQTQYLVHEQDLGGLVLKCLDSNPPPGPEPITVAHEQGQDLKEILTRIGDALGRRLTFVPVPWRLVWLALKTLEGAGVRTNFRSDSLIGMVYQDPNPSFAALKSLGFTCRPFAVTPEMLSGPTQKTPQS